MAMLEMQAGGMYSYFSGLHSFKDLTLNSACSTWPLIHVDRTIQNGHNCYGNLSPPSPNQPFALKEILKQKMLEHEAIFQDQIRQLHHLCNRQRELMDEVRNNSNRHNLWLETLQSNPFLSENSVDCSPKICKFSSLPWLNHGQVISSIPGPKSGPSNLGCCEGQTTQARSINVQTGSSVRESELVEPKLKRIGKMILDLELPADEYVDSEEEEYLAGERFTLAPAAPSDHLKGNSESVQYNEAEPSPGKDDHILQFVGDTTTRDSFSLETKPIVDLNEPAMLEGEEEPDFDLNMHEDEEEPHFNLNDLPLHLPRHNRVPCSGIFERTISDHQAQPNQIIQKIQVKEDPEACLNILIEGITEDQLEYTSDEREAGKNSSDLAESFSTIIEDTEIEQAQKTSTSDLSEQSCGKLQSYRENFDLESLGSNCSTNSHPGQTSMCKEKSNALIPLADTNNCKSSSRKHKLDCGPLTVVQALPCSDSPMQLSWKFRRLGNAGDKSLRDKKLKCGPQVHSASDQSCFCNRDNEFALEVNGTNEHIKDSKDSNVVYAIKDGALFHVNLDKNSVPDSGGQPTSSELVAEKHDNQSSGTGFPLDLNSCINVDERSPTHSLLTEVDMVASTNPGDKDSSSRTGESDENQIERTIRLSGKESGSTLEEIGRTAAEAIVSMSLGLIQTCGESVCLKQSKTWQIGSLHWFARIAGSIVDDPKSEFGVVLSCKNSDGEDEHLSDGIDFFEAMTLNLEEMKEKDYCFMIDHQPEEVECNASMTSQPRKGRSRRGRQQRKDFQSEILPSLASLSRHEVTKDLQVIGGLIEATRTRRNSGSRRSGANDWTEVTRRRRGRPTASNVVNVVCRDGELRTEESIIGWGNVTRRRRGLRIPASTTRLIFGQG